MKRIIIKTITAFFLTALLFSSFTSAALASPAQNKFDKGLNQTAIGDRNNPGAGYGDAKLNVGPAEMVGSLIKIILSLIGVLFMLLLLYGGFKWMASQGNDTEITKAKDIIRNALIGLIVILLAYAFTEIGYRIWISSGNYPEAQGM